MNRLNKKTIYLDTSDVKKLSQENHCDTTFDVSKFNLVCPSNQRLSVSLKQAIIPTRTTYITESGVNIVIAFQTSEPCTNPSLSDGAYLTISFSNNPYTPPFVISPTLVAMAVPFYISNSAEDLMNMINTGIDFLQEGGTDEAECRFIINSKTGILDVDNSGGNDYGLTFNNSYIFKETGSALWNIQAVKVARLFGINTSYNTTPFTIFSNTTATRRNRDPYQTHPVYVASEALLIGCNLNFDSYASVGNGVSNILSNIPTKLGITNRNQGIRVDGGDTYNVVYREGFIYHDNNNVDDSHKTVSERNINNIRLVVKDVDDVVRYCNTSILYTIECRWFS